MKRERFKRQRICNSKNIPLSLIAYIKYIREFHEKNKETIENLSIELPKNAYIRIFGKLIPISNEEIIKFEKIYTIIYK